jgi:hypothetical protein
MDIYPFVVKTLISSIQKPLRVDENLLLTPFNFSSATGFLYHKNSPFSIEK